VLGAGVRLGGGLIRSTRNGVGSSLPVHVVLAAVTFLSAILLGFVDAPATFRRRPT